MKSKVKEWTLLQLYKRRDNIKPAVFQRSDVWFPRQRRLLIDSILRGIDIPKIYLQKSPGAREWDIIDGHQRIDTIIGFFDDEFKVHGSRFSEMPEDKKDIIKNYLLTIVEVSEIEDEEVRLLFERLNLGLPLNSGERLNAIKSGLGDFIKERMRRTEFITRTRIPERRFAKEQVCAQICNNSLAFNKTGTFRNSKYEDLETLYRTHKDFSSDSDEAKHVLSVLDRLNRIFRDQAELIRNRASAISIFLFLEDLVHNNGIEYNENVLRDFYLDFLRELRNQISLGIDFTNRFLIKYQSAVIQGADTRRSITERHESLKMAFDYYVRHHEIISEPRPIDRSRSQ